MHIYILGFSILICQKIVIETNCIETHKVILNEHMYVYNIVEAQNKSAQKKYANLICNMQIVLKKISTSIYLWYILERTKTFICVEDIFHCSSIH